MKLYLIRHGESESNRLGYFAGQIDAPLTELGREQARCVAAFFRNVALDAVYASDLSRATDTLRPTAQEHGLAVIPEPGVREIHAGDWEGMPFTELPERDPEQFRLWKTDIGRVCFPNGESVEGAAARAQEALRRLAERHGGQTIAVASHGGIIRSLLALWEQGSVAAMQQIPWTPNASVTEVVCENGRFRVVRAGITEHLGALVTELPHTI